jgi:hypothetical protein
MPPRKKLHTATFTVRADIIIKNYKKKTAEKLSFLFDHFYLTNTIFPSAVFV